MKNKNIFVFFGLFVGVGVGVEVGVEVGVGVGVFDGSIYQIHINSSHKWFEYYDT